MSDRAQPGTTLGEAWRMLPLAFRLTVSIVLGGAIVLILVLVLRPRGEETSELPQPTPAGRLASFTPVPATGSPPPLLDDDRLFYEPGWGALQVRQFLESRPGVLAGLRSWVGDQELPLADTIISQCLYLRVNPKVVLALLELQSGLVDQPNPSPENLDWAMGYRQESSRGLESQIRWVVLELFRAARDYPITQSLTLANGERIPLPANTNLGSYAIMRVVAQTGTESDLRRLEGADAESFVQTYRRLFGQDPRNPPENPPSPADKPFLYQPYLGSYEVTCTFDHQYPFRVDDGAIIAYQGDDVLNLLGSICDGHDGWDYALDWGVPVLAAADGIVIWAGNADDNCATRSVVLDHENGYQTLYWHLDRVDVSIGQRVSQGETIGLAGASGCAYGPHLHFAVHFLGQETDPEGWCGNEADPWAAHPAGRESRWLWADRFSPCGWPTGAILVDNDDVAFQQSGENWDQGRGGVRGAALWAPSEPRSGVVQEGEPSSLDGVVETGIWRPNLPQDGRYRVYAFIPYWYTNTPDTQAAHYLVHHAEGEDLIVVDQALYVNRWVELGVFSFPAGREGFVYLNNLTDETGCCVWFDAVLWVPQ